MRKSKKLNILLLGATGRVGGLYVPLAIDAGHRVIALVRTPSKLDVREGLTVLQGDATDVEALAGAMKGVDVVVSCIGNVDRQLVMERTANAVLSVARDLTTPPKCVFISSLGANGTSRIIKLISIFLGGRKTFADYDSADRLIDAENMVPYVLVRPTGYTDEPCIGTYKALRDNITFGKLISRSDVAQFLFDATLSDQWNGPGGIQLVGQNGRWAKS